MLTPLFSCPCPRSFPSRSRQRKDGSTCHVEAVVYFFDFAVLWLLYDVTQLHQSQARFRMLFELSSVS